MFAITDITKGVAEGNYLLLAKAISQIENKVEGVDAYLAQLAPKKFRLLVSQDLQGQARAP